MRKYEFVNWKKKELVGCMSKIIGTNETQSVGCVLFYKLFSVTGYH